ncbi:MAG TPA: hypothetical protein VMW52_13675 [Phycisphaerae bacterium]|nr:hypothetical protein [Phycisphaerae bacterium]
MAGITWWTAERLTWLRYLAASGLQSPEIARRLSRRGRRRVTPGAVLAAAKRAGIHLRAGPPLGNTNAARGG